MNVLKSEIKLFKISQKLLKFLSQHVYDRIVENKMNTTVTYYLPSSKVILDWEQYRDSLGWDHCRDKILNPAKSLCWDFI